jgi:fibronectin-binding autotransporter adhesin
LNYWGKIDAKGPTEGFGAHLGGNSHVEAVHASHAPSDAIVVPDAQLLFGGEFKRAGVDLVLSGDGREFVLHDYFKGEKHAPLASPDGAHLTGDLVNALAGQVQIAQTGSNAGAGQVIGHVTKLAAPATAIRNGVSIILNNGDNVEKGDVVLSGSNSTLGITFIDGTVFGLSSNARMVLNEMVYDPNGSNNSSLLSLVAGTITFVAGETAKHGDMKIDTPVATMGIRGTAVLVEIDFSVPGQGAPDAKFQVLVEPDGSTGSYILFDKTTLTPLAVVDKAGMQINISNGIMSQTLTPLSPEIQQLINDVFSLKFTDNTNTKSLQNFTDTITPQVLEPIKLASGETATPVVLFTTTAPNSSPSLPTNSPTFVPFAHIGQPPSVVVSANASLTAHSGASQATGVDSVSGTIRFADINAGDLPSASANFVSLKLLDAQNNDITTTLTSQQIAAAAAQLVVTPSAGNNNNGSATWTYSVADTAFNFLTAGETLTLTYDAVVNNNYSPLDQITAAPFTITVNALGSVEWIHTTGGLWSVGSNWNSGTVPTATDDAIIPAQNIPGGSGFYDVTIETSAVARNLTLNANDTTGAQVTNDSTLTIGEVLSIFNNGVLDNSISATVSVGQKIELLDQSSLQNSGLITLGQGGDFEGSSNVTNSGTIEIAGGTLRVQVDVTNFGGVINIDNGATLALSGATIDGGTINDGTVIHTSSPVFGNIDVTGSSTISSANLNGGGVTVASGITLTLDNDTVNGTTFTDIGATIQIDDGTVLTLAGATVNGGIIDDGTASGTNCLFGSIDVTGPSMISDAILNNGGLTVASGVVLTLDDDTVNGTDFNDIASGATIQIDDGTVLTLAGATVNGGIINDGTASGTNSLFGNVDVTGSSIISSAFLNHGGVTVADGVTLTLSNDTVTGTTFNDIASAVTQSEGANELALNSAAIAGTIDIGGAVIFQNDVLVTNGAMSISKGATLDIENPVTGIGATFDDVDVTNSGTIQVDSAGPGTTVITLVLDGGTTVTGGTLLVHVDFPINGIEGAVEIGAGGAAFADVTVENNNIVAIDDGVTLLLDDSTVVRNGNLAIGALSVLDVEQGPSSEGTPDATLDGVTVTNGGNIEIGTAGTGDPILVLENGTLISDGALTIGSVGTLEVGAGSATLSGVIAFNANTIEVLEGGILNLDLGTTLVNFGAVTTVDDSGTLNLNSATFAGGTLNGAGTIETVGGVSIFEDITIANMTTVIVADGTILDLNGEIANSGMIALNSSGDATHLEISGNVLLGGSGQVALSDCVNNAIVSDGSPATLTNSDTIAGAGTIGDSDLTLVNDGTVLSTGTHPLIIDTGINTPTSAGPEGSHWFVGSLEVTNDGAGVLEASSGHTLQVDDNILNNGLIQSGDADGTSTAVVNIAGNITGTGSIDIFTNAKVEIGGSVSSGQTVTFEASNGHAELILDDPQGFHGQVKGLVEASSEAAENYVDLKGFTYTPETKVLSASFDSTTDITAVALSNGNSANNLTIALVGDYHAGNFEFADDGAGGTLFSDPGADSSASLVPTAPTLKALSSGDNFAFNFSNGNHAPITQSNTFSDELGFSNPIFVSTPAALNAPHGDGQANLFNAAYGHDVMIGDVHKVLLHVGDFHVV